MQIALHSRRFDIKYLQHHILCCICIQLCHIFMQTRTHTRIVSARTHTKWKQLTVYCENCRLGFTRILNDNKKEGKEKKTAAK